MVEEGDELAHDGSEREFLGFTGRQKALIKAFKDRVVAGGCKRGHIEHATHLDTAAVDDSAAALLSTVSVVGYQSGEGGQRGQVLGFNIGRSASPNGP